MRNDRATTLPLAFVNDRTNNSRAFNALLFCDLLLQSAFCYPIKLAAEGSELGVGGSFPHGTNLACAAHHFRVIFYHIRSCISRQLLSSVELSMHLKHQAYTNSVPSTRSCL